MPWFSGSIAKRDISQFVQVFTRDGSVCDVSYGVVMDMDIRSPTIQPAQLVEIDIDDVRWFTGYVVSVTAQRSAGTWVNRVVCDHYALKRLRDYYWTEGDFHIENNFVDHVIDLAFDRSGATSIFDYDISEVEVPPYTWSNGQNAYDVVLDMALFGMLQMNPYPDGTVHFQKMSPSRNPIDVTNRTTYHERRVDDAYFRTAALVLGWATEAAFVSGSNPYGYPRTMVVANPHVISGGPTLAMAEQLLSEYNKLTKIEKNTIPTRERINLGNSVQYVDDQYSESGIVMRMAARADESGFLQTITTGEKCPKIFGFEPMQPPPIVAVDVVIVMNQTQLARSKNFFTASGSYVEWEDIGGEITPPFKNMVASNTGACYVVADDGLYYCSDVSGDSPSFSLIMSDADYVNNVLLHPSANMFELACNSSGVFFLPVRAALDLSIVQYFWSGIGGAFSLQGITCEQNGQNPQYQFSCTCDDGATVIQAREHLAVGVGGWVDLATGQNDSFMPPVAEQVFSTTTGYFSARVGPQHYIFTTGMVLSGLPTQLAATQLHNRDGYLYWTRETTGYLMQNSIIQAIPNDVGGDAGVFSGSGGESTFSGITTVYSYGQIIALAGTDESFNSKRSIAYTEDGGTIWLTKDGNWNTIFPAGWIGYRSSPDPVTPIAEFIAVMPVAE